MSTSATPSAPETQQTPETTSPKADRQANGRFAKGNRGGTGNPYARQSARFRLLVHDAITDDDMREVVQALLREAKEGSVPAAKLLLSYSIGKPTDAPNPDRVDIDEWELLKEEQAESIQGMGHVLQGFPVELAVRLAAVLIGNFRDAFAACLAGNPDLAPSGAEQGKEATILPKGDITTADAPMANGSVGGTAPAEGIPAPSANGAIGGSASTTRTPQPMANGSVGGSAPATRIPQPMANGSNGGTAPAPRTPRPSVNGSNGAPSTVAATASPMANGPIGDILGPEAVKAALANCANAVMSPSANGFDGGDDEEDDDLDEWLGLSERVADPVADILRLTQQLLARAQNTPAVSG